MEEKVILQRLATKYGLSIQKVEEAVYYQFKYTARIIKDGGFESVRLPYLGKFHVLPGRLKHLNNHESTTTIKATKI
jgi:nucleoid DNA-binding protein